MLRNALIAIYMLTIIILFIYDAVGGKVRLASENKQIMFKTAKFWYVQTKLAL